MKKRTKILIAIAVYVVLVGVFFLIYNHFYQEKPYQYDRVCVWVKDSTTEYTVEDFKEYGVVKIEKISLNDLDDYYTLYINNPLMLKGKIDNLYKQLEDDPRIVKVEYFIPVEFFWHDEALIREQTLVIAITLTVLTGGLITAIICINKKHKD